MVEVASGHAEHSRIKGEHGAVYSILLFLLTGCMYSGREIASSGLLAHRALARHSTTRVKVVSFEGRLEFDALSIGKIML